MIRPDGQPVWVSQVAPAAAMMVGVLLALVSEEGKLLAASRSTDDVPYRLRAMAVSWCPRALNVDLRGVRQRRRVHLFFSPVGGFVERGTERKCHVA